MVNMKMSAEERAESSNCAIDCKPPEYPYGLCISLDDDALAKLGVGKLAVGQVVNIVAKATVKSTSEYESEGSDKEANASLQITDMELTSDSGKSAAEVLYGA